MVWYNPIDGVKSIAHGAQEIIHDTPILNEVWDMTKNTAVKIGGDAKRTYEHASNELEFGDIWGSLGEVQKGAGNIWHDAVGLVTGKVPTCAWDNGQVLEATLSTMGAKSPNFKDNLETLNTLWDESSNPPGYGAMTRGDTKYYDDNAWIGIALMDAHKQDPSKSEYVDRAKQIFDLEVFGTKGTDKLPHPGGVFWGQETDNNYRATVSTAGAAQLALSLYEETHDSKYLDFAKQQFDWVNSTLKDPKNGLYNDGIGGKGNAPDKITTDQWSYNQGLMLGDATMLYQATGDSKYLDQAKTIAKNSLDAFGAGGDKKPFDQQPAFFNAVFFKNLMQLDAVSHDNSYRVALSSYADVLKNQIANGQLTDPTVENVQASAAQVFALAHKNPVDT